jgi:hypothetical protein
VEVEVGAEEVGVVMDSSDESLYEAHRVKSQYEIDYTICKRGKKKEIKCWYVV